MVQDHTVITSNRIVNIVHKVCSYKTVSLYTSDLPFFLLKRDFRNNVGVDSASTCLFTRRTATSALRNQGRWQEPVKNIIKQNISTSSTPRQTAASKGEPGPGQPTSRVTIAEVFQHAWRAETCIRHHTNPLLGIPHRCGASLPPFHKQKGGRC